MVRGSGNASQVEAAGGCGSGFPDSAGEAAGGEAGALALKVSVPENRVSQGKEGSCSNGSSPKRNSEEEVGIVVFLSCAKPV
jgi:hypothetical protein